MMKRILLKLLLLTLPVLACRLTAEPDPEATVQSTSDLLLPTTIIDPSSPAAGQTSPSVADASVAAPAANASATLTRSATDAITTTPIPGGDTSTPSPIPVVPENDPPSSQATPMSPASSSPTPCPVRVEWPTYQVQAGDTLFKLAQQAGSTVDEIVEANCLASRDTIFAGMILRVPPGLTSVFPTTIPDGQTPVLYPADQCFGAPFLRDYGVSVGERWRVSTHIEVLTVYDAGTGNTPTGLLDIGENFTVQAGPTCYTQQIGASLHHFRRWQIASVDRNLSGWIDEYDAYTEAFSIEPNPTAIKFTASPQLVYTGDPITLEWEVEGANEVYIFSYHSLHRFASGTVGDAPDGLPPVGSITVYAPVPLARIDFTLGFSPRDYGSVTVDIICTEAYFADPGDIHACPLGPVDTVQAAFQPFERGFMVWRPDLNSETVWVFVEGDPSSHVFIDDWQGEEIIFDEQPPDALFQPVRGFGKVWVENDWVRRSIGWATAEEQAYDMEIQKTQTAYNATHHLLSLPDGRLVSAGLYMGTSLVWSYTTRR